MAIHSLKEYEGLARRRLPYFLSEYIDGGSYEESTLHKNRRDLALVEPRQRVLRDVSEINITTGLFGREWTAPFGLGPVGLAGMFARRGEVQAAQAAERAGIPFCLSTMSVCSLEEIHKELRRPTWFQLYMVKDRGFVKELLSRAADCGCNVLVLTVDMPVPATRYRDFRSGLSGDTALIGWLRRFSQVLKRPAWFYDVGLRGRPHNFGNLTPVLGERSNMNDCVAWIARNFDASVTWKELDWIKEHWKGSIVIKGIMDAEDARLAVDLGIDGIVVSNHGGRQLDGVSSTIRALPLIVDAAGDKLTILADGGVRSGIDVTRMLAMGAKGVLLGRPWAHALAAEGQSGVEGMINTIKNEFLACMAMTGCSNTTQLDRQMMKIHFDTLSRDQA